MTEELPEEREDVNPGMRNPLLIFLGIGSIINGLFWVLGGVCTFFCGGENGDWGATVFVLFTPLFVSFELIHLSLLLLRRNCLSNFDRLLGAISFALSLIFFTLICFFWASFVS